MIDWDIKTIEEIEKHYNNTLNPSINFIYFCRHFEEIYIVTWKEEEIIPDIFNDITYYTFNGINARYKILLHPKDDEEKSERILVKRMKQIAKRQEARKKGLDFYHNFIITEIEDFVQKYPFWKELLKY